MVMDFTKGFLFVDMHFKLCTGSLKRQKRINKGVTYNYSCAFTIS